MTSSLSTEAENTPGLKSQLMQLWLRLAASGFIPPSFYLEQDPHRTDRAARTGSLKLEIASHCWRYSHLLQYQLSSLVLYPPVDATVTMTVLYSGEDTDTRKLLSFFGTQHVPNVSWNWIEMPPGALFRRGIGRNRVARNTEADWVWFTDCDTVFEQHCLDSLADALQGRTDPLVFPDVERVSELLQDDNPLFTNRDQFEIARLDTTQFSEESRDRATGPLQIVHGDTARQYGYCAQIPFYQQPADRWTKAHEDRAFRWLMRTPGVPITVPNVYRIKHVSKGRYTGGRGTNRLRSTIRKLAARLRGSK